MVKDKLQLEVCKALIKGNRVSGVWVNDNEFAVTPDGYKLFVFTKKEIVFDTDKCVRSNIGQMLNEHEKDVPIKPTNRMVAQDKVVLKEYENEKFGIKVYINEKYAKLFEDCYFYANAPISRVLIKDYHGANVGVVMPVRKRDETV